MINQKPAAYRCSPAALFDPSSPETRRAGPGAQHDPALSPESAAWHQRDRAVTAEEFAKIGGEAHCPHCGDRLVWVINKPPFFRHRPNRRNICRDIRIQFAAGSFHTTAALEAANSDEASVTAVRLPVGAR